MIVKKSLHEIQICSNDNFKKKVLHTVKSSIEPALKFYPHLNCAKMCFELLKGMDIGQYAITSIIFQNELLDGKK